MNELSQLDAHVKGVYDAAEAMARAGEYEKAAEFLDLEANRDDMGYTGDIRFPMMERAVTLREMPGLIAIDAQHREAELKRFANS